MIFVKDILTPSSLHEKRIMLKPTLRRLKMNISEEIEKRVKSLMDNKNVKYLMSEVDKATKELKKLEVAKTIEATASQKLTDLDSRYKNIRSQINKIQKQVDLEMSRAYSTIKTAQKEATKSLVTITKAVENESQRLKKVVKVAAAAKAKKPAAKKKVVKKAASPAKKKVTKK